MCAPMPKTDFAPTHSGRTQQGIERNSCVFSFVYRMQRMGISCEGKEMQALHVHGNARDHSEGEQRIIFEKTNFVTNGKKRLEIFSNYGWHGRTKGRAIDDRSAESASSSQGRLVNGSTPEACNHEHPASPPPSHLPFLTCADKRLRPGEP